MGKASEIICNIDKSGYANYPIVRVSKGKSPEYKRISMEMKNEQKKLINEPNDIIDLKILQKKETFYEKLAKKALRLIGKNDSKSDMFKDYAIKDIDI
jgi:autonomous glycyl radical cofactor GrcA